MNGNTPESAKPQSERESMEQKEVPPFSDELKTLRKLIDAQPPLEGSLSNDKLLELEKVIIEDHHYDSIPELFRRNEISLRRKSMKQEVALKKDFKESTKSELIVANQGTTYHDYFPQILHFLELNLSEYERLRADMSSIPEEMEEHDKQTELYLQALNKALTERLYFGNVLLADEHLGERYGSPSEVKKLRDEALSVLDASSTRETHTILTQGDGQQKRVRGNELNQRIIDLLAGKGSESISKDFFPHAANLDLLTHRYQELLEKQKQIAKDPEFSKLHDEFSRLSARNRRAEEGTDSPLTEEEGKRYEELRKKIKEKAPTFEDLGKARKSVLDRLIKKTDELGSYQIQMEEVTAIQNMFGNDYDLESAGPINEAKTPEDLAKAFEKNMEERRQFHLERLDSYAETFEKEVLNVDMEVIVESLWNEKGGRDFVREISNRIASTITAPLPETGGIRDFAKQKLAGPLNEAMGWPEDKIGMPFESLTPEEQTEVLEKSRSILTAMKEYDKTKIQRFRDTVILLKSQPSPSKMVTEGVPDSLPNDYVTAKNRGDLETKHGKATVTMMLLRQLDENWGSVDPPSGMMGEHVAFFEKVNENIDVHLDVGKALHQMSEVYKDISYMLLLLAAGALVASGAGMMLARKAYKGTKKVIQKGTRLIRGGARRVARPPRLPSARSHMRLTRRGIGHASRLAGEVLIGLEIARQHRIYMNMEPLPEEAGVAAALEIMRGHPSIDRNADRFPLELRSLELRREMVDMQNVVEISLDSLRDIRDVGSDEQEKLKKLIERGDELLSEIKEENHSLKLFFPITDYMKRSTVDPSGVLRASYRYFNSARKRGTESSGLPSAAMEIAKMGRPKQNLPTREELEELVGSKEDFNSLMEFIAQELKEHPLGESPEPFAYHENKYDELNRKYYAFLVNTWALGEDSTQ